MLRRVLVVLVVVLTGISLGAAPARAVSGGSAMAPGSSGFVARLDVGGVRACSGALVSPQWLITAASCFAAGGRVRHGAPALPTTATVGGTNLPVKWISPHSSRDIVLAQLSLRLPGVAPIAVGGTAPAVGDAVLAAGYGRTATDWVPDQPHAAPAAVGAVAAESFTWTGQDASACQGDAGGPVFRTGGSQPDLVGIDIASGRGGCLDASDAGNGATAVRVDDLRSWITGVTADPLTIFRPYSNSSSGIGDYDLADPGDQVVPFDYDHSGQLDHLVAYRPGTGIIHIVKHNADDTYATIFTSTTGIGGYNLASTADRIVPFDYDHSGKLDHLLLYRPGRRTAWILKHGANTAFTAVSTSDTGIGEYDLADPRDQLLAFDYDHSGKPDHLVVYRPGDGIVHIVKHATGNSFISIIKSTGGIGGYDLKGTADRIVAFDYDHSGKLDHLVLYRPGSRIAWVVKHGAGTAFSAVYTNNTDGIAGYNLASTADQIVAFDYDYSGKLDHLVLYRPGSQTAWIVKHGAGSAFSAVYNSSDGIAGYNLASTADRIVAFDRDHSGGANHLFLYRPGSRTAWVVGRDRLRMAVREPLSISVQDSIMEDYSYPGAADILERLNVRLISGDGHILLADCDTEPVDNVGVIQVWTTEQIGPDAAGHICFQATGSTGRLALEVPGVFLIRGDGQQSGYGHRLTAVVDTASGEPTTVVVDPSGYAGVGSGGADPNSEPTTLLQLRIPA
jgi:Trypsin